VRYRGPAGFEGLEKAARMAAQARFSRGQIAISLQARRSEATGRLRVNEDELVRLIEMARRYVARGGVSEPRFDGLLSLRGVLDVGEEAEAEEDRAQVEAAMARTVSDALDALREARRGEGAALTPVLLGLVEAIEAHTAEAERESADQPAILKARFQRRLGELLTDHVDLDARIVQEASLLAAKADVREELDRLGVHARAARALLGEDGAVGRKLDFLTQEFMREANTLCSKSALSELTARGLDLKAVIEQFREQVQNVE